MIIKQEKLKRKKRKIFNLKNLLLVYFFVTFSVFSLSFLMVVSSVTFKQYTNQALDKLSRSGRMEWVYLPKIILSSLKSHFYKVEELNINIRFEDLIKIEKFRKEVVEKGIPNKNTFPNYDVEFDYKDKKFNGRIRLKGDRIIHYYDKDKVSFKTELENESYLFRMNKFSIQKPKVRNYIHEWIFHELSTDFNLIKLQYKFLNLSVNGEKRGLFVIEEGFGKELVERNGRRNGPIFGLDEDLSTDSIDPIFEVYNKKFWNRDENKEILFGATKKLDDFFSNKIEAKDIFDLEKWASYFAIIDLTGTLHGALLKSVKFYYNPINGLFEPIPFDGHKFLPNFYKFNSLYDHSLIVDYLLNSDIDYENSLINETKWLKSFFFKDEKLDQNFYNIYIKKLKLISSDNFIETFLSRTSKEINKINSLIYADQFSYHNQASGMGLYYFSRDDFIYRKNNIKKKLNKSPKFQVLEDLKNQNFLVKDFNGSYSITNINKIVCGNLEIEINQQLLNFSDNKININHLNPKKIKCDGLIFLNEKKEYPFYINIDYVNSKKIDNYNFKKKTDYLKYFEVNQNILRLKNKTTFISDSFYIPDNYTIIIDGGEKIVLTNNAFIFSNSPWQLDGKKEKIIITGLKNNFGGGLLITDTVKQNIFNNVEISYLNGYKGKFLSKNGNFYSTSTKYLKKNGSFAKEEITTNTKNSDFLNTHNIMGAININNGSVYFKNVIVKKISSEDAINVFSSNFIIENMQISEVSSDAIDIDFSKGKLNNLNFLDIGNDAIDFSGSKAEVQNINFKNVGDKLISVGEQSNVDVENVSAENSFVGIVSKDGSYIDAKNINLSKVKFPFAAYKKKNEYKEAKINVEKIEIKNFISKWITDEGSRIIYNNKITESKFSNILDLIYKKNLSLVENL